MTWERSVTAEPLLSPERAVLDAGALARLAELDPTGENQLLARVMKTFQTSAARLTAQLESARRTGDRPTIRIVAHTLKSSSGYIGAQQLVSRCAELESASRSPTSADLNDLLDAMIAELEVTLDAIARRLPA